MQISYPVDLPTLEQVIIPQGLIVKKNTLITSVITWMNQGMGSTLSLSEQDFS
ncbi:hypothetical protein [Microseira sp. BLCC-F43]|jgi:hypothetical protein|uniref:hypothetical protein n=1 Tax=Microseira sp. BLCC-F43 TaxID=3153602 RepID=UPI0035B7CAEB